MTTVWVTLAILAVVLVASFGYLGWRDRRRLSSADDSSANRAAISEAERHAAERHGGQGATWNRGQLGG